MANQSLLQAKSAVDVDRLEARVYFDKRSADVAAHRASAPDIVRAVPVRPRRFARSVLGGAMLLAIAAPVGDAASRPQPMDDGPLQPLVVAPPQGIEATAYAGETRLYVSGRTLWRLAPEGRPLRVARLPGSVAQVEASPDLVALVVQRGSVLRLLAGPPTGPLRMLAKCRGPSPELPYIPMAVAGDVVAEALSCPRGFPQGAPALRIHAGDAVRVETAPPDRLIAAAAGAPGVLATASARATDEIGYPSATVRIEVRSTATGVLLYALDAYNGRFPGSQPMVAVQQDGTAIFCDAQSRLAWASPSAPESHAVVGIDCPSMHEVALAGGLVLHHSDRRGALQTTTLATSRSLTLLPDVGGQLYPPFAWNGRTALVHGYDCVDDFLGEIASDAAPYRGPSCVVHIVGVRRTHGRRVIAVTLACPRGCRGNLHLSLGPAGQDEAFQIRRRGRSTIRIRLQPHTRRALLRYRSLPFDVTASYVNPRAFNRGSTTMRSGRLPGDGRRRTCLLRRRQATDRR